MDTDREQRMIKADRRARILLAGCVVILSLGGALAISLIPWARGCLEGQDPRVTLRVLQGFTAVVFLSFLPIGVYMFRFGHRAVRSRQMPPPGTWVICDTRVVEGDAAVRRGRGMMVLAIALFVVATFSGLWLPYKFGKAFGSSPRDSAGQADRTDGNQPAANPSPPGDKAL